jgi:predicted DNA-binding protein (MmcQ/YjbR family)
MKAHHLAAIEQVFKELRKFALKYPETREDRPWGESAIKVRGKSFVFMRCENEELGLSVKLTDRHEFALEYPFVRPTGYGLGKSGWVSCRFTGKDKPPLDVLKAWVDESYRAVAPKKLVAELGGVSIAPAKVAKRR